MSVDHYICLRWAGLSMRTQSTFQSNFWKMHLRTSMLLKTRGSHHNDLESQSTGVRLRFQVFLWSPLMNVPCTGYEATRSTTWRVSICGVALLWDSSWRYCCHCSPWRWMLMICSSWTTQSWKHGWAFLLGTLGVEYGWQKLCIIWRFQSYWHLGECSWTFWPLRFNSVTFGHQLQGIIWGALSRCFNLGFQAASLIKVAFSMNVF